jgi:hypothetical protein
MEQELCFPCLKSEMPVSHPGEPEYRCMGLISQARDGEKHLGLICL